MYTYRTGMVYKCTYRQLFVSSCFLFIFCKDDSEMLRHSKKLSNFSMMFTEKCHSCNPPPPPPKRTYEVSRGKNRYMRLP